MRRRAIPLAAATACGVMCVAPAARAAIGIDGILDAAYGSPLAVQTNNSGFGDNVDTSGASTGGSELDAAYGTVQNGNLNLFFAGNFETNYNHLNVFIADGRPGQSTLSAQGSLAAMNGSKFSSGFNATYALDLNGGGSPATEYVNANDLNQANGPSSYLGSFTPGDGAAHTVGTGANAITISLNNTNTAGVAGGDPEVGSAANQSSAAAVTTGFEIAIPLSVLGTPRGAIQVLADINGGSNGYLSNQFLPGLPTVAGNVGYQGNDTSTNNPAGPYTVTGSPGAFNLSTTPGAFFTVPAAANVTNANAMWQATGSGHWGTAANWVNGVIPGQPGDAATFGPVNTAAATVSLDTTRTVGQLTFNSPNSYTLTGGTLVIDDTGDALGVNPSITVSAGTHTIAGTVSLANGVTVTAAAGTALNITNPLAGTGPLTKGGPGTLALANYSTFTGSATVLAGTLELDNNAAAANATVSIGDPTADNVPAAVTIGVPGAVVANAILTSPDDAGGTTARTLAYTATTGTGSFTGPITLDGGLALKAPVGTTLNLAGHIADGQNTSVVAKHDLTVNADGSTTGQVMLSGASSYSGVTTVNAGALELTAAGSLASPVLGVNAGATFGVAGTLAATASLTSNGITAFRANPAPGILNRTLAGVTIGTGGTVALQGGTASSRTVLVTPALSIAGSTGAWAGQLDLGGNDLILQAGNLATTNDQIRSGMNAAGAAFAGPGITSSVAAADARHTTAVGAIQNADAAGNTLYTTFDGQPVTPADVLVRYTYYGDTNLDGVVNGADYSRVDAGFIGGLTGWGNGDFNYDGVVDGSDYTLMDNAFNQQTGSLGLPGTSPNLIAAATAEVAAAVPEPASVALAVVGAGGLLARRRRSR